jgi:competence ComEA-like helix-hairpin-helix protein
MKQVRETQMTGLPFGWALAAAAVILGASVVITASGQGTGSAAAGQAPAASATQPAEKDAATLAKEDEELATNGDATLNRLCTGCHDLSNVTNMNRTGREWNDVVDTMAAGGAGGSEEELKTIKRYLTRFYGMVAVNTATADDLVAVLGLTKKEADAIIQHRTANGKFADLAAVLKVPGIDAKKIEDQSASIVVLP